MNETKTCAMCNHPHTKEDGSCDCGCKGMMQDAKVCEMCSHEHKNTDGTCECGCGK
jgi:hypothetical protein